MYIPKHYKEEDTEKLLGFMRANSFGILINSENTIPHATHLPFVIKEREGKIIFQSHMAKPNPQWKLFEKNNDVLVIFQGPHSYISPSFYEKKQNVPTWNYIAVHAYGKIKLLTEKEENISVLEDMINVYEKEYYTQWKTLSQDYIDKMIKGIVSFEIEVTTLQGKYKLSQNKTTAEQNNIITSFEKSDDSTISGVAEAMKQNLK